MISVLRRYKFTVQDRDRHGNVRVYLRMPGKPKIRLHETVGTPAFDAEYRKALVAKPEKKPLAKGTVLPGSIDALCVAYFSGAEFKRMTERSQQVRRLILDKFRMDHGTKPAARLEAPVIRRIMDSRSHTPEAANGLLKALRAIYAHGVTRELVKDNPALKVPYLAPSHPDGFRAWTEDDVAQFEAHWPIGTKPRLALALLLYTGQRRSDVVLLGKQHVRDGWLHFTQVKNHTRKPVRLQIPVSDELQDILDATPQGDLAFLVNEWGRPFTGDGFGNSFRTWARAAGLMNCSPHGLRKLASSRFAEAGATAHEIAAVTGHGTLKETERYTRAAAQRVMAGSAFRRLTPSSTDEKKSHQSAATLGWDENASQPTENKDQANGMVPRGGVKKPA